MARDPTKEQKSDFQSCIPCEIFLTQLFEDQKCQRTKYSKKRAEIVLGETKVNLKSCWHPSPASPLANKNKGADWRENFKSVLPK